MPLAPAHVVFCDGGLANRLNELLFALALKARFGGEWELAWPRTNWCGAAFANLFDLDWSVHEHTLTYYKSREFELRAIVHQNFGNFAPSRLILNETLRSYDDYRRVLNGDTPILYSHHLIPDFVTLDDLLPGLRQLRVNRHLARITGEFCRANNISTDVMGLHIRKTDFGNRVDDQALFELARKSNRRFFVCSDSAEVNTRFAALPNCLVFPKASYPVKVEDRREWASTAIAPDGNAIGYNIERPAQSIEEALVDLLILSQTSLVDTSASTFLRMAMIFRATAYFQPD